jgi:hypothetical protein
VNKVKGVSKYKVEESFQEFLDSSKVMQRPKEDTISVFGANPDNQEELPFDQERAPEIGEYSDPTTLRLDKMQTIIESSINKANMIKKRGDSVDPYINRQLDLCWGHLREAYLRLMDMKI